MPDNTVTIGIATQPTPPVDKWVHFGTVDEVVEALGISKATAIRDWRDARAWLTVQLESSVG